MNDLKRYWLARKDNSSNFTTTVEFVHDTALKKVLVNFRKYDSREDLWEWIESEWKFGNMFVRTGEWMAPSEGKLVWNHSLQEGFVRIDSVEELRQ
jgi:hypothetical protein